MKNKKVIILAICAIAVILIAVVYEGSNGQFFSGSLSSYSSLKLSPGATKSISTSSPKTSTYMAR